MSAQLIWIRHGWTWYLICKFQTFTHLCRDNKSSGCSICIGLTFGRKDSMFLLIRRGDHVVIIIKFVNHLINYSPRYTYFNGHTDNLLGVYLKREEILFLTYEIRCFRNFIRAYFDGLRYKANFIWMGLSRTRVSNFEYLSDTNLICRSRSDRRNRCSFIINTEILFSLC